jgi:aldehyde dehydrogenase family 7 protein A1
MISKLLRSRSIGNAINIVRNTQKTKFVANNVRCLSTFDKHRPIFEALGLDKTGNKGVFDGEWKGSGEIVPSYNPVNNEVIAEVITVSNFLPRCISHTYKPCLCTCK